MTDLIGRNPLKIRASLGHGVNIAPHSLVAIP